MKKRATIDRLIRICDSTGRNAQNPRSINNRKVQRIKDSNKRFVKRKVKDSTDDIMYFEVGSLDNIYVSEAYMLNGFPNILVVQVGDVMHLLPTALPGDQQAVFNLADQQQRLEIINVFLATCCEVGQMSGWACGSLVTGDWV